MKSLRTINQVAADLGIAVYRIKYALETNKVPGPTQRVGNLRVFTSRDVERIRKHFEGKSPGRQKNAND
jgi:hypothetical protein